MPFVHIRSLPFASEVDLPSMVEGITRDFAKGTSVALEHVTATWDFFPGGAYAVAGRTASSQPRDSHPVLVDLLAPDFNSPSEIKKMLRVVAASIARRARIPQQNIFINFRAAHSGMVFDHGKIVRW